MAKDSYNPNTSSMCSVMVIQLKMLGSLLFKKKTIITQY